MDPIEPAIESVVESATEHAERGMDAQRIIDADRALEPVRDLPLVTVIVTTRDRPEAIARCVDCLAQQSWPKLELIVVDDASGEATRDAIAEAAARHPGLDIRTLHNAEPLGTHPSRNRALAESEGELVAFCDDDCFAEPDWIEALVDGFEHDYVAAVTGLVLDPPPRNIWELALRGEGQATNGVAGNMCVRRELLEDLHASGRGDEHGLLLRLEARGLEVAVRQEAVVLHVHPHDGRSFFRQGWRGGLRTARLSYKYGLAPRAELLCLLFAWPALVAGGLDASFGAAGALFAALFLAAITGNELLRKGKSMAETLRCLPVLLLYYHARAAGYAIGALRIALGRDRVRRVDMNTRPGF